jgi:uncharacterized protein
MLVIGGIGIGLSMMILGKVIGVDLVNFNLVLTYILPLVPAFVYFVFKGNEATILKSNAPVPLNSPHFGRMNIIIFALVSFIALIALGIVIDPLAKIFPMPEALKHLYTQMSEKSVWSFLSIAICAPIVEETYLRGMMERGMLYHRTPLFAILWSSFFFAFIHMNLSQAIPAFLLGILFGWIYYRTHCLWATVCMHAVNNATSYIFFAAYPTLDPDSNLKDVMVNIFHLGGNSYLIVYVASAIAVILCIWLLHTYLPKHPDSFTPQRKLNATAPINNNIQ